MRWIKDIIFGMLEAWDSFWFKPVDTITLACFRFFFCSVLFVMYLIRFFDIRLFFYESGLMNSASAQSLHQLFTHKVFYLVPSSDMLLYLCHLLFIVILLCMVLGLANRLLALLAFLLHLVFLQRNPSIVFGPDVVATFWLFCLIFSNSNKQLRWVHYFLNKRKGLISERAEKGDWLNTVALRFIQIQLCVIYMFSGLEKLKLRSWWEDTAIWEMLSLSHSASLVDFSFLLSIPLLMGILAILTVLFEIYFPVLVWTSLRKKALLIGLCFHVGMALCLNVHFFSLIMLSAYIVFVPAGSLRQFIYRLKF